MNKKPLSQDQFKATHTSERIPVILPTNGPFMIHPDEDENIHWRDVNLARLDNRWYLVSPTIVEDNIFVPGMVRMTGDLLVGIRDSGELFLLPVTRPTSSEYAGWERSLASIADEATCRWMTMQKHKAEKCFVGEAASTRGKPRWPPRNTIKLAFDRAFAGRVIDEAFVRRLSKTLNSHSGIEEEFDI